MASTAAVPRLHRRVPPHSARTPRNLPVIPHPMAKLGDKSELRVTGRASVPVSRPQTVAGYPSMSVATCFSWSDFEFPSASRKKRRYRKKAMATKSRSDEKILETVTERLVDGFQAMKHLFKENDPDGGYSVTQDALQRIMVIVLGFMDKDRFDRMLVNLGLNHMHKIPFDMFVSRFKEFKDIQRQWTPPVRREMLEDTMSRAHPEEHLRDCDMPYAWAQLRTASQATFQLKKAIREKRVDFRGILPDECFEPDGIVTKVQMRTTLQELGVNLTDLEYKKFWERYDTEDAGYLPLKTLFQRLDMNEDGEPGPATRPVRTPVILKANTGVPPRNPAQAAREFAQRRHKIRGEEGPPEGVRGSAIQPPGSARQASARDPVGDDGQGDGKDSPTADTAARAKIRAALNQKRPGKFDCIIDCLHYKFEERYNNLMMAFKLFDIYNDGSVMRIDLRRVLSEFGLPVTAVQLGPLMHRLGMIINSGLISYTQMLAKLMNRGAAFTSQILDDKIQALSAQDGGMSDSTLSDTDEEAIARTLVEMLHQDYIKLAVALLRCDRANKGVLPLGDLRNAVENCLGYNMTESQWKDFQTKIPYDSGGNVRYIDFMVSFSHGEPGTWNQVKAGAVSVPRNKVVPTPSEEVKRLEKNRTASDPVKVPHYENRPIAQLRKDLQQFFKEHLHDVDKRFKEIDRKSHKRFSKWQFGALLKLCGFPITEKELTDVWLSIKLSDDNMSTFNNVVMEFAPGFSTFRAAAGEGEGEECSTEQAEEKREASPQDQQAPLTQKDPVMEDKSGSPFHRSLSPNSQAKAFLAHIMAKTTPAVRKNWEFLRQGFRNYDFHGLGNVTFNQMQNMLDSLNCGLSTQERDQLCAQFDFKGTGRPNYLAFMKAFGEGGPRDKFVYNPHYHYLDKKQRGRRFRDQRRRIKQPLSKKPKDSPNPITVDEALQRIHVKLIKHWKNLRRGFQKHDRSRTGSLSVLDFKRVLKECEVPVSEEDLYHILSEFDANMDGRISYIEFLDALCRA